MDYNSTLNAQNLGMYYQDYNFLMALAGSLCGFTVLFFVLLLIVKIASKG